jgi:hypothetical protein
MCTSDREVSFALISPDFNHPNLSGLQTGLFCFQNSTFFFVLTRLINQSLLFRLRSKSHKNEKLFAFLFSTKNIQFSFQRYFDFNFSVSPLM